MNRLLAAVLLSLVMASATAQVDVNTASQAELEALKGIGVDLGERLLAERAKRPFGGWPDLIARVPGIRAKQAAALSAAGLRVGEQAYAK